MDDGQYQRPESERIEPASDMLERAVCNGTADLITLGELKASMHERGFGVVMLVFSVPLGFIPPGVAILVSLPVMLFAIQMIMALDSPWMPQWLERKSVKRATLAKVIEKTAPGLRKLEKFIRPRLYFASSRTGEQIIGVFSLIFALSVTVPFPLTNLLPGIAVAIMSLGLISRDGVMILLGMVVGSIGTVIALGVLILGENLLSGIL